MVTTKEYRAQSYLTVMFYILSGDILPPLDLYSSFNPATVGVCEFLKEFSKDHDTFQIEEFPEFVKQIPKIPKNGQFGFWWPIHDKKVRLEALSKAIDLCK
jgi:hypothetical protein